MIRNLPQIARVVQRNCDVSDARHAGEYGLCTFLLKMREYYRWENELPFTHRLPGDDLGEWLKSREQLWSRLESEDFAPLPLEGGGECDPFDADAANDELLAQGCVYGAGYGRFHKPMFFLGRLLRVEERAGLTIRVSSCEYARELTAPPAMLQGRTIYVRQESVRRFLWERVEEWQWSKRDNAMARALAEYDFIGDTEAALARMADNEMESMILHEIGEAMAGEALGSAWGELALSVAATPAEPVARAVRDLLADCLSTLPQLIARRNTRALHFHFATFDAPRRQLFPEALRAYGHFLRSGELAPLSEAVLEGSRHWLATARGLLALEAGSREGALKALLARSGAGGPEGRGS